MATITGLITVNQKDILEVDADPSAGAGTPAATGSLAMFDNAGVGQLYLKFGAADTDWSLMDSNAGDNWLTTGNILTGGSPSTPNEFFGSNNAYDVVFKANALEVFRLDEAGSNMLIGLTISDDGRLQSQVSVMGDTVENLLTDTGVGTDLVKVYTKQYKVLTTNATTTALATIPVPTDKRILLELVVSANQTAGSAGLVGDGASFQRVYNSKNVAGTVTNGTLQTSYTDRDAGVGSAVQVSIGVSGTNTTVSVKGATNRDLTWTMTARISIAGA